MRLERRETDRLRYANVVQRAVRSVRRKVKPFVEKEAGVDGGAVVARTSNRYRRVTMLRCGREIKGYFRCIKRIVTNETIGIRCRSPDMRRRGA